MAGRGRGQMMPGAFPPALVFPTPPTAQPRAPPAWPQDTGTFEAYQCSDGGTTVFFQTVTFKWPHQHFSLEELRLNDYTHDRGVIARTSRHSDQSSGFNIPSGGLVAAALPVGLGWANSSCRAPPGLALDLGSQVVTLRVGREGESKDFAIHRNILTRRSPFMREALTGQWQEAKSGVVTLPDDEPAILQTYQQWLYNGCIHAIGLSGQESTREYAQLAKCYILGEKLLDTTFKDCVIDSIIQLFLGTRLFDPTLSGLVYGSTPAGSPLRRLWQDIYLFGGSPSWLDDTHDPNAEFAIDLSRRQMGFWQGTRPQDGAKKLLDPCQYHEHGSQACYRNSSVPILDDGPRGVVSALWS